MNPLFSTAEELNAHPELFYDPERTEAENEGPFLIVQDNFYENPGEVRAVALGKEFHQYSPPLAYQVGEEIAAKFDETHPAWVSSSLLRYHGKDVNDPKPGYRHALPEIRRKMEQVLDEKVTPETWNEMGDWWNGAFHVQFQIYPGGFVHHHFKEGDVAPPEVGTTIWKNKKTGKCIATKGASFETDLSNFELAFRAENTFNRLVLFRENVLHRAEHGFGTTLETGRMTQTFFFHSERKKSEN